jgi:hypothetical protein
MLSPLQRAAKPAAGHVSVATRAAAMPSAEPLAPERVWRQAARTRGPPSIAG